MDVSNQKTDPPARDFCLLLFDKYEMLPNIRAHSVMVAEVSMAIADALCKSGHEIDLNMVEAGALLHDITKTQSIGTKENHAETGEKLLVELGYPKTGQVVGEHIIPKSRDALTPCEIVAYADKRVLHDHIVGLEERFVYLIDTYGSSERALAYYDKMRACMLGIERQVVEATGAHPTELIDNS